MIVVLQTNSKHDFVCKILRNKNLEIVMATVDPCHLSLVELVGPIDPGEPEEKARHDCALNASLSRDHTQEIQFVNVPCNDILPNSNYTLKVEGNEPINITTGTTTLSDPNIQASNLIPYRTVLCAIRALVSVILPEPNFKPNYNMSTPYFPFYGLFCRRD